MQLNSDKTSRTGEIYLNQKLGVCLLTERQNKKEEEIAQLIFCYALNGTFSATITQPLSKKFVK